MVQNWKNISSKILPRKIMAGCFQSNFGVFSGHTWVNAHNLVQYLSSMNLWKPNCPVTSARFQTISWTFFALSETLEDPLLLFQVLVFKEINVNRSLSKPYKSLKLYRASMSKLHMSKTYERMSGCKKSAEIVQKHNIHMTDT